MLKEFTKDLFETEEVMSGLNELEERWNNWVHTCLGNGESLEGLSEESKSSIIEPCREYLESVLSEFEIEDITVEGVVAYSFVNKEVLGFVFSTNSERVLIYKDSNWCVRSLRRDLDMEYAINDFYMNYGVTYSAFSMYEKWYSKKK